MAAKSESKKKAGSTCRSTDAGEKDRLIIDLKDHIAVLENELRLKQDIKESKKAEIAQRESEDKYHSIIEQSSNGFILVDEDGVIVDFNPAGEQITGLRATDWIGKRLWDFNVQLMPASARTPGMREQMKAQICDAYRTGLAPWLHKHMDITLQRPDDEMRTVQIMTFPLRTSRGSHFGTFIQDVTERRRAEVALQENEIFLSNVFRSIQDGISVLDKDLNVIRVNHAMEKWYRHNIPLVGKKCYEVYHGRSEPCESCPSLRTIEHKTMQNEVVPLVGESGPVGWVELYTFPMLDGGGNVIGIIEQVRDITERKRIEDELIAAKQQAELYLDLMGHDINNMHQIALGYLELARDMQADAGQKELLNTPIEVLQRSARLIHNVRKLQRLREGVFQTELVDVCKVVSNVQREFGGVPGKTITLNLNNHEHCYIMANELFHDVISNLVSNAIRHTGNPAEIIIDIDRVVGAGKPCYRIIIEDDGPGIPDDSKGKIFNRMHGGSARGLGLGLYLVKSLVDSYGGRVLAGDRVPGDHTRGAKFVVMLPAAV